MVDNGQLWERTNTPFPDFSGNGLPSLPQLQSVEDYVKSVVGDPLKSNGILPTDEWLKKNPFGAVGDAVSGVGTVFNILTNPGRVITVMAGLIFIAGGLYLLGQSTLVDAIKEAVRT